jgi:hypothetical protein
MKNKYECELCHKKIKFFLRLYDQTTGSFTSVCGGECSSKIMRENRAFCKKQCDPITMPSFEPVCTEGEKRCINCKYEYVELFK